MTQPGDHIGGRYRLVARLGAGAMGVVWQAVDERLGRTVAVKQLVLPGETARERAMREGRVAARLNHPNAIAVFDVADHDGTLWLVMEYLAAPSLAIVLAERGPLPPRQVAAIGAQLADALYAAHAAGVVHRDVKPGNVLLGADGVAKLTDLGISRAAGDVTVTGTGVLAGTPAYLAPEVARGGEPNAASDVFALGATLYTAMEGQPPFGWGDNALDLLHQVADAQVVPPREAGPLSNVLMAMLQADPARRPSMAQAREALGRVAADEPLPADFGVSAFDEPVEAEPVDSGRRRGALLVAGGIALTVLVGLFGLAATTGPPPPPPAQDALAAPQDTSEPVTTAAPTSSAAATTTTTSPTTTTTTTQRPPSASAMRRTVDQYYDLLPKRPEQAWDRLGPAMRAQGFASFAAYWRRFDSVRALQASADPASMTVRVLVAYRDNRRSLAEVHELTLIRGGDGLLIDGDRPLGGVAAPTTTRRRG